MKILSLINRSCFLGMNFVIATGVFILSGINASIAQNVFPNLSESPVRLSALNVLSECRVFRSNFDKAGTVKLPNGKKADTSVDQVFYCPDDFGAKTVTYCNAIDDQAPEEGPTLLTECPTSGPCIASNFANRDEFRFGPARRGLGRQDIMLELVKAPLEGLENDFRYGCWGYDPKAAHLQYQLEIVCCK